MALRVVVIGATGSVGQQTLQVIDRFPDKFVPSLLVGGKNLNLLKRLGQRYGCSIFSPWLQGSEKLPLAELEDADIMVYAASTVDYLGHMSHFLSLGKPVCLSTKEIIVEAWPLIKGFSELVRPVDSEHSALWRIGAKGPGVKSVYVVGSGGSLRDKEKGEIENATLTQVLSHPVWEMGPKVTFDSAFLINKSMEVIEAAHLFNLRGEQINIVIERTGSVHALVDFVDGSRNVFFSRPTMLIPIAYALSYPDTLSLDEEPTLSYGGLEYRLEKPDFDRFPWGKLGHYALELGHTSRMAFSVADEIAFECFRNGIIKPSQILYFLAKAMEDYRTVSYPESISDYFSLRHDMIEKMWKEVRAI